MRTIGISPKVLYPLLLQLAAVVGTFLQAGEFGKTQWTQLGIALLTTAIGYVAGPGEVSGISGTDLKAATRR